MLKTPDERLSRLVGGLFEPQNQKYFTELGLRVSDALFLHETGGLLDRKKGGEDWSNVSKHCLMEAARVEIFADMLGLRGDIKNDLVLAAAFHDFNKKQEVLGVRVAKTEGVSIVDALYGFEEKKERILREAGFSERVIRFAYATGGRPEILLEVRRSLDKNELSLEDLAFLIAHYVDAYTQGSSWVQPVSASLENDLERRMLKNEKTYAELDRQVLETHASNEPLFSGKTLGMVMRDLGHEIERRFVQIIFDRTKGRTEPIRLPEVVDYEIKKRIRQRS